MILRSLSNNLDAVLARITQSHLERYRLLLDDLTTKDVGSDLGYQCIFNGFYKMQRRSEDWYRYYFKLLETKKNDPDVTFQTTIEQIYADKHRVEPSFSSKLVATIHPDRPVYDKHVRENLSLTVPAQHISADKRLKGCITMYAALEQKVALLIKDPLFTTRLKPAFDAKFHTYARFTDVKKLDFLLWQFRKAGSSN